MAKRVFPSLVGAFLASVFVALATAGASFPDASELPSRPSLPDPLVMFNGEPVTTKEQWINERRPELKALFQHYMYGHRPPGSARFEVQGADRQFFGGKATRKQVTLRFDRPGAPKVDLLVVIPNKREKPVPAFVGLNFSGNHTLVDDPAVPLPDSWMRDGPGVSNHKATDAGRGTQIKTWALEQTIDRGYAVAVLYYGDVEPDRPNAPDGIRASFQDYDWGAVAAWAWGLSRGVDYMVADSAIDPKRIAVVGHSRNGKAALVAAAFDERIAMAIPLQAGCGGTAPSRGTVGESVKQINTSFPHWFNAEFKKFNEHPDRLPFDQHCLIALCAPRPVLLPNAMEDQWANPNGQFEMLQAAEPVYKLLGAEGLEAEKMPEPGKLVSSPLGYYIRPGKHSMTTEDWKVFLDFADRNLR
ncbi:MAG: acetylxylan esterase [Verrucomicrobiia bacterium]